MSHLITYFPSINLIFTLKNKSSFSVQFTDIKLALLLYKLAPIDGMVVCFDDLSFSESLGRTGELALVALFDTVEIDSCDVSRASLHNLSFIKNLELHPGCRILVSKRNMIIPHIEENLDRGHYEDMAPRFCPCCNWPLLFYSRKVDKERIVETLHYNNPNCSARILQKFVHFVEKKAMNIFGLSEATLAKFIELGYLNSFQDIYHLDRYREEIIALEGFGEKSYEKLQTAIDESRNTTFARYLIAMDIPMIGRTASRALEQHFNGSLRDFELAAMDRYDFTCLSDFGEILRDNIHEWFHNSDNILLWRNLQKEFNFKEKRKIL